MAYRTTAELVATVGAAQVAALGPAEARRYARHLFAHNLATTAERDAILAAADAAEALR
jgi:hypothetical protein